MAIFTFPQAGQARGGEGDPAYYIRFSFKNRLGLVHEDVTPEVFMVLRFEDAVPKGQVECHQGSRATS